MSCGSLTSRIEPNTLVEYVVMPQDEQVSAWYLERGVNIQFRNVQTDYLGLLYVICIVLLLQLDMFISYFLAFFFTYSVGRCGVVCSTEALSLSDP